MEKMILIFAVIVALAGLTGCAVFDKVTGWAEENRFEARLMVNQGVARYIQQTDDPQATASRVRSKVADIAEAVDDAAEVSLGQIEEMARAEIDWHEMDPADAELVDLSIQFAAERLRERMNQTELLSPDDVVRVQTLLQWISDAASRYE